MHLAQGGKMCARARLTTLGIEHHRHSTLQGYCNHRFAREGLPLGIKLNLMRDQISMCYKVAPLQPNTAEVKLFAIANLDI